MQVHGKHVFWAAHGAPSDPPVVLIHGERESHAVWGTIGEEVAERGYRVLVPDLPGHGASQGPALASVSALADWLAAFIDAAGLDPAALAGHSLGALAALDCAARHPARVRTLILLGAAARIPAGPKGEAFTVEDAAPARVACPAVAIVGAADTITPPAAGRALADRLVLGRVIVLEGAGHMMMRDKPEATRDALLDALDPGLDPEDWEALSAEAHRMLDESLAFLKSVRRHPVWQPMPTDVRGAFDAPLPRAGQDLGAIDAEFRARVEPYATGNVHPGFMGWVHGGGTVEGMLAEMLAGGLNANLGGRDHAPIEVERQILRWMRTLFSYPEGASGLFLTGTSLANFLAVLVARTKALGPDSRRAGVGDGKLVAYASTAAHGCVPRAFDMSGLGAAALRPVATDADHRIDMDALTAAVAADRAAGLTPFMVIGSAGTVDVGAVDPLAALADFAKAEGLWFHVDGALGALGMMSPELAPVLAGIERSDSIAFDFHKWGQVPYDAGYLLVRDGEAHRAAFASPAAYLRRETRGLAAGSPWPCDYGPDLSRGFRALKTWVTLKAHGTDALGAAMARCCRVARHLATRVDQEPLLERLAPVALNIVCFHVPGRDSAAIAADLHEAGIAAPSTTTVGDVLALRAAIVNHRTREDDVDRMLDAVLSLAVKQ